MEMGMQVGPGSSTVFTRLFLKLARPPGSTVVISVKTLESWAPAQPTQQAPGSRHWSLLQHLGILRTRPDQVPWRWRDPGRFSWGYIFQFYETMGYTLRVKRGNMGQRENIWGHLEGRKSI